jgi:uncharacterized membrane protein YuzA (DUF378 family)
MNVCSDFLEIKSKGYSDRVQHLNLAGLLEALFFVWIGAFAALTFLVSLILGAFQVLSLTDIAYIYAGISGVTACLAVLLYAVRDNR